jgi:hypothetical protein
MTMKPKLKPANCPFCNAAAQLVEHVTRYRRGDRVLAVDTWTWECVSGCAGPDGGEAPFRFSEPRLMKLTDERAAAAWLERFGEPMPPSRRGQRRGQRRTVRVPVMLTPAEAERLDRIRGDASRSEFLRGALSGGDRKVG